MTGGGAERGVRTRNSIIKARRRGESERGDSLKMLVLFWIKFKSVSLFRPPLSVSRDGPAPRPAARPRRHAPAPDRQHASAELVPTHAISREISTLGIYIPFRTLGISHTRHLYPFSPRGRVLFACDGARPPSAASFLRSSPRVPCVRDRVCCSLVGTPCSSTAGGPGGGARVF